MTAAIVIVIAVIAWPVDDNDYHNIMIIMIDDLVLSKRCVVVVIAHNRAKRTVCL